MRERLLFLASALRHPHIVSSVIPTIPGAARTIAKAAAVPSRRQTIVELGAGSGPITRALLKKGVMHPKSTLIVVEVLPELAAFLRRTVQDPRCTVIEGDACDISRMLAERGIRSVDAVISGIPFSALSSETSENIMRQVDALLTKDGTVAAYQVRPTVRPFLSAHFPSVTMRWLPWNLPPLRLFTARR